MQYGYKQTENLFLKTKLHLFIYKSTDVTQEIFLYMFAS